MAKGGAVVYGGGCWGGVAGNSSVGDQVRVGGYPVQRRRHRRLLRPLRAPPRTPHRLRQGNQPSVVGLGFYWDVTM
jgi:hypothetical protein